MLTEVVVNAYMETAVETCVPGLPYVHSDYLRSRCQVRFETADVKVEPDLQALTVVRSVNLICYLWQQYVNTALLPLASSAVTIRREMVVFNNQAISRLEGSVNQLLHRATDGTVAL